MPNSILWIGLVAVWIFVLFPMLADRHPRIRRTTDAALATRVLHRGGTKRRTKKGPGAGHETDPDWVPARAQRKLSHGDDAEDRMTTSADEPVTEDDDKTARDGGLGDRDAADEIIDAEVDEGGPADEAADTEMTADDEDEVEEEPEEPPVAARIPPARSADRSLPEPESEFDSEDEDFVPIRRGRGGYDPEADAIARAARYRFRQRSALGLVLSMLLFGAFAVVMSPVLWWGFALSALVLGTYLVYLRRQVRLEEEIRRRRAARLSRNRPASESDEDDDRRPQPERPALDRDSARALRRRAVVLDVDDEDPMFDHLEHFDAAAARATRNRAAGGEIRRAAGE
ncbi:gephyrin-like molybdotransferase receptor GlpR [Nocardia transvalensis]|uniref:divisome protein SepX/GlpR n=1 Tax=Nocardia transvalensis TaxID=37333 RepID=UPI0018945CAA|nr:gephyrin-like molybdotransferase receptor GlpR [Nocardia transvalensis]MBF6330597.1 hypothetical protein [Nocardia transvalensis]